MIGRKRVFMVAAVAMTGLAFAAPAAPAVTASLELAPAGPVELQEFRLSDTQTGELRDRWMDRLEARYAPGTWAPMRMELTDSDLRLMGLPSTQVLTSRRYPSPTMFDASGNAMRIQSFAGTGYFGIRPGAWVLFIDDKGIGWCSLAHVYGSPGSYKISTAGHCGKVGDTATVIGVVGDGMPVLLDFGKFSHSQDGGLGQDWALIDVFPEYQELVSPTMAFWGGPRGMYSNVGATVEFRYRPKRLLPNVEANPDPTLAQQIVHYGHGVGVGAGGTPRSGTTIHWGESHFMFSGAITFGDSGSGANTLTGDTVGATMEAAGILTHIWIDPLMRQGVGIMGGTRATQVNANLANGQLVPYPLPLPFLP